MDPGNTSPGPSSNPPPDYYEEWDIKPDLFGKEDDSEDSEDEKMKNTKDGKKKAGARGVPEGMVIVHIPNTGGAPLVGTECHVMVDGYFRKGRGGGFGAVLVWPSGLPLAALAGVAERPVSGLYHVLQGMLAGLFLAHEKKMEYVILSCNSDWAYWIMESCNCFYGQKECASHPGGEFHTFCIPCLKSTMGVHDEEFALNSKIIREIILYRHDKFKSSVVVSGKRYFNRGADFLAKFLKGPGPKEKIFEPKYFPNELQEILKDTCFPYA